ncbi:MAG TPA: hypothetical protein VLB29_06520 [Nocardioidaceae bacterium]|nr:hypothetical protein [Nocardioidaceae bacterium]
MTPLLATIVLTALAAVVVVLTRVRLAGDDEAAGRLSIPTNVLNTHTFVGVPSLLLWVAFLYTGIRWLGAIALLGWWITVFAGLLILLRWMPAKGRHASGPAADTWGEGPGLSVLAHVGLLVGVIVFTVLFLVGSIPG